MANRRLASVSGGGSKLMVCVAVWQSTCKWNQLDAGSAKNLVTEDFDVKSNYSSLVGPLQSIHNLKKFTTCTFVSLLAFSSNFTLLEAGVGSSVSEPEIN